MDDKELAAELQASKHDPDEWGDAEVGLSSSDVKKRLTAMVSVRLTRDELMQVQQRAQEREQSVSAYLREVALREVSPAPRPMSSPFGVTITTGGTYSAHVGLPGHLTDGRRLMTTRG